MKTLKSYIKFLKLNEEFKETFELEGKFKERVEKAKQILLDDLKLISETPNRDTSELLFYLNDIYDNKEDLLKDLLKNGIKADDIISNFVDNLDHRSLTTKEKEYKLKVMNVMYDLIKKNIDKIDLIDL